MSTVPIFRYDSLVATLSEGQKAAGRLVRTLRGQQDLSVGALAGRAGVAYDTVRLFEREERWPRSGRLHRIEEALGLTPGSLAEYAHEYDLGLMGVPEELRPSVDGAFESEVLVERRLLRLLLQRQKERKAQGEQQ